MVCPFSANSISRWGESGVGEDMLILTSHFQICRLVYVQRGKYPFWNDALPATDSGHFITHMSDQHHPTFVITLHYPKAIRSIHFLSTDKFIAHTGSPSRVISQVFVYPPGPAGQLLPPAHR